MDPDKVSAFLHKLANAKVITLILIVGAAAYFIHKNLEFITEITFKVDRSSESTKQTPEIKDRFQWANVNVDSTLIPFQFDIPSYFLVSATNSGPAIAKDMEVLVDVGRAKITSMDIRPKDRCKISSGNSGINGPIRVLCQKVNVGESIYIYSLLSEATFRSILVTSPNLPNPISVGNLSQPISVEKTNSHSSRSLDITFASFVLWLIESIVVLTILIVGFYLLSALIRFLDKFFGTNK